MKYGQPASQSTEQAPKHRGVWENLKSKKEVEVVTAIGTDNQKTQLEKEEKRFLNVGNVYYYQIQQFLAIVLQTISPT